MYNFPCILRLSITWSIPIKQPGNNPVKFPSLSPHLRKQKEKHARNSALSCSKECLDRCSRAIWWRDESTNSSESTWEFRQLDRTSVWSFIRTVYLCRRMFFPITNKLWFFLVTEYNSHFYISKCICMGRLYELYKFKLEMQTRSGHIFRDAFVLLKQTYSLLSTWINSHAN